MTAHITDFFEINHTDLNYSGEGMREWVGG